MSNEKSVVIYQRVLPHYRVPFFKLLHSLLKERGIELTVVCGFERQGTVPKTVIVDEPWVRYRKNYYIKVRGVEITWQTPIYSDFFNNSVVVVEHSNRLLLNFIFYFLSFISIKRLAFWGHGKNYQNSNTHSLREKFKRKLLSFCDHYFVYTEGGRDVLRVTAFDTEKITVVENSIDTSELVTESAQVESSDVLSLKNKLGINSDNIAIYCGGMYKEKRLDFLLECCRLIKKSLPDFYIVLIGDGPDSDLVEKFASENPWVIYVGSLTGTAKVRYFKLAKCQLMPGLVGLGILDSFALSVPLVTTNIDYHSPEISYLENDYNGLITENSIVNYSETVVRLFNDKALHKRLLIGCRDSASKFTVENMALNFTRGLVSIINLH